MSCTSKCYRWHLTPSQLSSHLTGCVNNHLGHVAGERKQQVRRKAEDLGLIGRENILVWGPERNGP
jgi:fatty-acid desaturase